MAKGQPPERAEDERHAEHRDSRRERGSPVRGRKKQTGYDGHKGRVYDEVVPLDEVSDRAGGQCPSAKPALGPGVGSSARGDHEVSSPSPERIAEDRSAYRHHSCHSICFMRRKPFVAYYTTFIPRRQTPVALRPQVRAMAQSKVAHPWTFRRPREQVKIKLARAGLSYSTTRSGSNPSPATVPECGCGYRACGGCSSRGS